MHAHHSPAIIYYSVLDQRSRDPYRLLAYVHTSGSFAKKDREEEREEERESEKGKGGEKARPSETNGARNEKEEQGQRMGEKMPKKRNGSATVSVFYCRRICRIDRHSREDEKENRKREGQE